MDKEPGAGDTETQAPLSERLCDWVCLAFALWTLCCGMVVATGGGLDPLIALYAAAWWIVSTFSDRWRVWFPAPSSWTLSPQASASRSRVVSRIQDWGLKGGLLGAVAVHWFGDTFLLWWWILCLLGMAAVVFLILEKPYVLSPVQGRSLEVSLWTIAVACVVLTLVAHRPDIDDAFYINIAAAAADAPRRALFSVDTLHGIEGLPLHLPVYRVHSYELWNGALSSLMGIPAIHCFHWISAALGALLVPLAYAKLFRLLTPRLWLWAVIILLLVLVAVGETHRWYGNFAFVRMWQGKSLFLCVFLPLVYTYALRFALQPNWRDWFLLGAAQISAVGCSSSALWAAPIGAFMILGSIVLHVEQRNFRILLVGALASAYILGLGWFIKGELQGVSWWIPSAEPGERLGDSLEEILGTGPLRLVGLSAMLSAWAWCPPGLAQRFAIGVPLLAFVTLLNPYVEQLVLLNVTGPSYWRGLWAVPIPILVTLLLIAPLQLETDRWRYLAGRRGCLILVAVFVLLVPKYSSLSQRNHVSLGRPALKVPPVSYQWAAALNRSVPPGSYVVAPPDVSAWVTTFHEHAYPLQVRLYLWRYRNQLDIENIRARILMSSYVAGQTQKIGAPQVFREGLEKFRVSGVCLRHSEKTGEARAILREAGFQLWLEGPGHDIWVRS